MKRLMWKDIFDRETGFFRYLIDRKCFARKNYQRASSILPTISLKKLVEFAENAPNLHEGVAEALLIELAKRLKDNSTSLQGLR